MVSPYEEGRQAYMSNDKNPYERGTWDRREWKRGWNDQGKWLTEYHNWKRNSSLFS